MIVYLKSVVKQLRNYNATIELTSLLIDKPWALIDDEHELQKLIFRNDKTLILSKNGQVQIGKWEYFPEAKSILIDRNIDKILCNEAFIDEGVMILRLDGTENRFFILANENMVPDLDALKYLEKLRHQRLRIIEIELIDGRILEVQRIEEWDGESDAEWDEEWNEECDEQWEGLRVNNLVTEKAETAADGKYQLAQANRYFEIKKGRIYKILTEIKYKNPNGQEIVIQQQANWKIMHGDYVFISGNQVDNAIIEFSKSKNLVIREGIVIRLEPKNKMLRWLSKIWRTSLGYYKK